MKKKRKKVELCVWAARLCVQEDDYPFDKRTRYWWLGCTLADYYQESGMPFEVMMDFLKKKG